MLIRIHLFVEYQHLILYPPKWFDPALKNIMEYQEEPSKLSTILNRFRKTTERLGNNEKSTEKVKEAVPENVVHADGLSALPQPEQTDDSHQTSGLEWPVVPEFISPQQTATFESLGVSSATCERLHELQYSTAFAVQTAVIPLILSSQASLRPDPPVPVLVNSFTGSGKTLAYTVPIVDVLRTRRIPRVRALILLPTKVLTTQVHQVLEQLSQGTGLRVMSLKTDRTVSRESQLISSSVPDIIVSAPGRLVEHLNMNPNLLEDLRFLVVDEADRLVGQSFQNWTDVLAKHLPLITHPPHATAMWNRSVQRLVFSATLTRDPSKLAALQISNIAPAIPRLFVVGQQDLDGKDEFALPQQLHETMVKVRSLGDKPLALTHELVKSCEGRVLVFVRSNEAAARLARLISLISLLVFNQLVEAKQCSGEMRMQDRRRVLKEFEQMDSGVLVCTDLIARGIDMHIDYVVNYDVPLGAREYVHRVGRTARAGADGNAFTLVSPGNDTKHFMDIQSNISRTNPLEEIEVEPEVDMEKYQQALQELGQEVTGR